MSLLPQAAGSMRIIAVPLARTVLPTVPAFYSFRIISPPPVPKPAAAHGFLARRLPEEGLGRWASHKANTTWKSFGKAPDGTWKLRAFRLGERLMDRLDFEEVTLKTIDISIAPKITGKPKDVEVPLLYAPSVHSGPESLENLKSLAEQRIPIHRRGVATWIFLAILSAPLKLIPIIPNLPFYFCAWRSWSHFKAMRAARYLQDLIRVNAIVPRPYPALDGVYAPALSGPSATVFPTATLGKAMKVLSMEPEEAKELLRAHDQVLSRLGTAEKK
ncbi:unnamed protein product [Mycena citricolor]|uniref:Mitochondrial K+-H+ exchange-related-domain-containing protein n=1 Tax=Mycena citricolor TaxID=2018698 RepID=A0AAD2HHC3_9AGAR|nr:unnamed protein product [Mycena citricolor]CAK5275235.1 unnamed protein product [Mycena citricolor]